MKKTLVAAVLAGIAAITSVAAHAAPENYVLDGRHSFPVFQVNHLGLSLQWGRFKKASGRIVVDREARTGSVDLSIDAASIDMGLDKWDEVMRSEDYFNVAQFPTLTFRSSKLLFDGDKVSGAEGEFTMLGVTRPATVSLAGFNCIVHPINKKNVCGGMASATIRRSEFGMTKGIPGTADEVRLNMAVEAFKE
jgi:polyisoprenoid-binding protein YceI